MKENLINHYDEKYLDSRHQDVKVVEVRGYPRDRFQAAVFWGGEGESLLEVGAGSGSVLLSLSRRYKKCIGTEFSPKRADELKKLFSNHNNVEILTGDFEQAEFDFPDESFDTIIFIAVIEHLINPFAVIEKAHRLLKPGGKIIIDTPNLAKWTRRIKLLFGFFPSTSSLDEGFLCYDKVSKTNLYDDGHLHYFTYRSLKKMLLKFNFSEVEMHGYGKTFLSRIYPRLFSECFVIGTK